MRAGRAWVDGARADRQCPKTQLFYGTPRYTCLELTYVCRAAPSRAITSPRTAGQKPY